MSKVFKLIALCTAGIFLFSSTPFAHELSVPITIGATVGAIETLAVTPVTIATGLDAAGISFTDPGLTPWTVANEYLRVEYSSNQALWAVRIVTDNRAVWADMAARPLDLNGDGVVSRDAGGAVVAPDGVSYGGLVNVPTRNNPDNRADLGWQVYVDPTGAGALDDASFATGADAGGPIRWNAPWAYIADVGNTGYDPEVDSDNNVDTLPYTTVVQGGAASSGLAYHPAEYADTDPAPGLELQPKPGDGDVAVYLGARFGGVSAGAYSANLMVQMFHE